MTRERWPYLALLVLTAALFLAAGRVPYRVDSDTAFQLKSVQQWLRSETPDPGTLRLPDPGDLSRDTLLWSNWWPPAFPALYTPLAATGLPLADAIRITSFLLFLLGSAGWLRLAGGLRLSRGAQALFVLSLAAYAVTIGGASSLRTADVLGYCAGPWLALLALASGGRETGAGRLFLCGLALGGTYWVRYSIFLAALPLAAWVALGPAQRRDRAGLLRLAALGIGFALPVAALFLFNLGQAANVSETVTGTRSAWDVGEAATSAPLFLALSLAGAPGLGLFQSDLWLTHLAFFSDAHLPFLRGLGEPERLALKAALGIPGTLALAWALLRACRRRSGPLAPFAALVVVGFYGALTAVSIFVGYNYLAYEPRFSAGFLPLAQGLLLSEWWEERRRVARALGILLLYAVPLGFVVANFAKNDVYDRRRSGYVPSANGFFLPEISSRDVPAVRSAVAAVLSSPRDVVVLAGTEEWGGYSAFVPWLEFPQRTLPVGPFHAPLGARYHEAGNLNGTAPYRTSRPLRVVLVAAQKLAGDGTLARLQARFPQAGTWQTVPAPEGSNVAISWSDLR